MEKEAATQRARLDRLALLTELARHAAPEDRARLERTIQLISIARQMVARIQKEAQRPRLLVEEAEANELRRRSEHADLLARLQKIHKNVDK